MRAGRITAVAGGCLLAVMVAACPGAHEAPADAGSEGRPDATRTDAAARDGAAPADAGPAPADLCVEVGPSGGPEAIELPLVARMQAADVTLLVDVTGSMGQELQRLRDAFRSIVLPGLRAAIPDLRLSVAWLSDLMDSETHFFLLSASTADPEPIATAIGDLQLRDGGDGPEAQTVALWQLATGEGFRRAEPADCPVGTAGYPCYPAFGGRVIVLFTDAAFHNGPDGAYPYTDIGIDTAPSYGQTLEALHAIGARVVGVYSGLPGAEGEQHLRAVTADTRTVDAAGEPIVRAVGRAGETLPGGTVDAVQTLVDEAPLDLDLYFEEAGGGVRDASGLVDRVEALRAEPAIGATLEGNRFLDVRPETTVVFQILFRDGAFGPEDVGRRYRLVAVLRDGGVVALTRRVIELVVTDGDPVCP